ncbi:hypothetical protein KGF57_001668 [Candida theae]|uniref:Uncharacterized protein n=1 Tax=Candida theae TaxID=1198502 RepID=A0AAD5BGQ8_9ASCO|nr:uncharacterized protein KGF57_001668 [Candida theae]KAI5961543.1 hypothetical protein KGF57_001668 [Candida theae]
MSRDFPPATTSTASLNYDSALTTFSNYNVAVAYQPKDRKPNSNMFEKSKSSPALVSPSGEDNLFVFFMGAGWINCSGSSRWICSTHKEIFTSLVVSTEGMYALIAATQMLYEGHLVLIDCILRHFHSIKYLKVISRRFFYWVENSDVDFCDAIPGYIRACKLKTIFIFNQYIRRPRRKLVQPEEERTWFYLPLGTRQSVINLASQLSNITTLLMDFDQCVNYSNVFTNMKLRKLSIKRLRMPNNFIVDEVFNTENLQELTLVVSSPLNRFFSVLELDTKYPRLFSLCLQYRKTNEKDSYANDLLNYKHKTLEMLTVCYGSPRQVPIKTMCSLSSPFPVASINLWFYWELECQDEDSEKIIMMSPRVPHGIVGVHLLYIDQTGLDEWLMSIKKDAKHEEFSTPKAYYTQWELYQIFAKCCRERKNFILPRDRLFRQYESIQKRFPLPKDYVA